MNILNLDLVSIPKIGGYFFSVLSGSLRLSVRNSWSHLDVRDWIGEILILVSRLKKWPLQQANTNLGNNHGNNLDNSADHFHNINSDNNIPWHCWSYLKTISNNGLANLKYITRWPSRSLSNMDQRDTSASKYQNVRRALLRANSIILTVRSFTLNYLHPDVRLYQMALETKFCDSFFQERPFQKCSHQGKIRCIKESGSSYCF